MEEPVKRTLMSLMISQNYVKQLAEIESESLEKLKSRVVVIDCGKPELIRGYAGVWTKRFLTESLNILC